MIRCEDIATHPQFTPLSSLRGVAIDLRYASADNFTHRVLYRGLDCAWLRVEAADGVQRAADWLREQRPEWRLCVLDALRPQRVQEAIWADFGATPLAGYFADPARGSIHSFGMAVDVTLLDGHGQPLDMGAGFDQMDELSHPALDVQHLALGRLQVQQLQHRGWLYAAMAAGGFQGLPTEWWHFDHGDRERVRREYPRVC